MADNLLDELIDRLRLPFGAPSTASDFLDKYAGAIADALEDGAKAEGRVKELDEQLEDVRRDRTLDNPPQDEGDNPPKMRPRHPDDTSETAWVRDQKRLQKLSEAESKIETLAARNAALEAVLDSITDQATMTGKVQAELLAKACKLLADTDGEPGTPGRGLTKDEAALVYNCRHDFSEYASEESRQRLFALITRLTGDQP